MMHDLHWKIGRPFNLAHKLKRTENILKGNETRETEMEVLLCKMVRRKCISCIFPSQVYYRRSLVPQCCPLWQLSVCYAIVLVSCHLRSGLSGIVIKQTLHCILLHQLKSLTAPENTKGTAISANFINRMPCSIVTHWSFSSLHFLAKVCT